MLGAYAAKSGILSYCANNIKPYVGIILTIIIVFVRCKFINNGFFDPLVALLFVMSLISLLKNNWGGQILLRRMGSESTNIWLVHTFICCYYFSDIVFELRYPLVIFIVTLLVSYIIGLLLTIIQDRIIKYISL